MNGAFCISVPTFLPPSLFIAFLITIIRCASLLSGEPGAEARLDVGDGDFVAEKITRGVRTTDRATAPAAVNVAEVEKQVSALDVEVQQAMQSGHQHFNREFKDFMGILETLISEIQLDHPNAQLLESLGVAAQLRWQNLAKKVLAKNPDGTPVADQVEMNLVTQSKSTMDSVLLSATLADQRNRPDQNNGPVDNSSLSRDDASMTDMTRQQVTDLLAASEAKMDARLANFDTSIKTGFADIRSEFSGVRADFAKMQADVSKGTTETIKWAIALAISVVIMTVGLLTFINKSADKPAAAPPAPIVIYAQPANAAPPAAAPTKP